MSNIVLTTDFVTLLKADGTAQTKGVKTRGKLIDHAIELGIDFTKETMSPEQIKHTLELIAERFPAKARALLKLGAAKADGQIAEDHDGTRFNSQGRAKNWNYWNNLSKRIMKDLAKAVVKRQRKAERVANGGNQTRTFVERQCDEVNKLANAVVKVDPDTLPDDIDIEGVLEAYRCVAREVGFQILIKD